MRNENLPRHVAIIMDGNGRWAKKRHLPRIAGHKAGIDSVRKIVRKCAGLGIEALTLFAFSSENWRRPHREVDLLMDLFCNALRNQVKKLHKNGVKLRIIGDRQRFSDKLNSYIESAEAHTDNNTHMELVVAVNYGGRWDIVNACRHLAAQVLHGHLQPESIDEAVLRKQLCLPDLPEPDLFIRTGGEQRVSNFLLWQLAYTELYFTETLWPDFNDQAFALALTSFAGRQRRFGRTGDQLERAQGA